MTLASAVVLASSGTGACAAPVGTPAGASSASGASSGSTRILSTHVPGGGPTALSTSRSTNAPITAPFVGDPQGTEFWLMFMTHRDGARQALYITGEAATNGVVSMPALGASAGIAQPLSQPLSQPFSQPFSIVPGVTTFVQLPADASMPPAETLADRGVRVVSNAPVSVVAVDYAGASSAAYLAMPVDALGTRHVVVAQGGPGLRAGSQFGVAAAGSGAVLTVTPSQAAQGHAAGVPFEVVLGPSQTWQLRSTADGGDLSGSLVESTAPVALFAGHSCVGYDATAAVSEGPRASSAGGPDGTGTSASPGPDCDPVADAMPPVNAWGRRFVALPGPRAPAGTGTGTDEPVDAATVVSYRIVAANDETRVRSHGVEVAVLARGQVWEMSSRTPALFTADRPVMVVQLGRSPTGGATGRVLPPVDQYRSAYTFGTPDMDHVVDIVVPMAGVGGIVLDGAPVPASRFLRLAASDFATAQLPLVTEGAHSITGTVPFNATVRWSGRGGAYAYSAGQSWAPLHFDPPLMCDADDSGAVDTRDIALLLAARGTVVRSGDLRDANRDGIVDVVDARRCALQCGKPGCAE